MDRWPRFRQIFQSALDQAPDERSAFVRDACGDDRDLRAEVESLLIAYEAAGRLAISGSEADDSLSADLIGREIGAHRVVSLLCRRSRSPGPIRARGPNAGHSESSRFLIIKEIAPPIESSSHDDVVVVLNWLDELKRLVPAK